MDAFSDWFSFSWPGLGAVVVTTVAVYATVLAYTKLAGLRSFSKLSSFDFVVTVAIGSIVSSVIILEDVSLVRGAVALAVLFAIQETIGRLRLRYEFVARSVGNVPMLLMDGPRVLHDNLKRVRVSEDEVRARLRDAGVLTLSSVRAVVMETTGELSVMVGGPEPDAWLMEDVNRGEAAPTAAEKPRGPFVGEASDAPGETVEAAVTRARRPGG